MLPQFRVGGVLAKARLIAAYVQCRPDSPRENLFVGVGPVCWASLPTGLSEWELGPCHAERSPIIDKLEERIGANRGKSICEDHFL